MPEDMGDFEQVSDILRKILGFDGGLAFIRSKNSLDIFSWAMWVFCWLHAIVTNKR
jgi:hypothetical protein